MATQPKYVCRNCGHRSAYQYPTCGNPKCKADKSYILNNAVTSKPAKDVNSSPIALSNHQMETPLPLSKISSDNRQRITTGVSEFDRVIGGGLLPGSTILLAGDPGIGKSTLLAGICNGVYQHHWKNALFISAEENAPQISDRMNRLGIDPEHVFIVYEPDIDRALKNHVQAVENIGIVIVDSINTMLTKTKEGTPGSPTQMSYCEMKIRDYAKNSNVPVIIISQVTKSGQMAGSNTIAHAFDALLYLEGDNTTGMRILRAQKSRLGATSEIGVFQMSSEGLEEVEDVSRAFMHDNISLVGCTTTVMMEGPRPIIFQVESLVAKTPSMNPARRTTGYNKDVLSMISASLQRHGGLPLNRYDIWVNCPSNISIEDRILDLSVGVAIISSLYNHSIPNDWVFFGEMRLTGAISSTPNLSRRIVEAARLGYTKFFVPVKTLEKMGKDFPDGIEVWEIATVADMLNIIFPDIIIDSDDDEDDN